MADAQLSITAAEQVDDRITYLSKQGAPERVVRRFVAEVREMQQLIGSQPQLGVDRPELGGPPSVQSTIHGSCSYLWTAETDPPLIVAVLGPGQDPEQFFSQHHPADLI